MNKVFKVIWSKAKSAWIVVSEFAKNHDAKSGSCHDGRKGNAWLVRLVMLMLVLGSTVIMPAYAAEGDKAASSTENSSGDNSGSHYYSVKSSDTGTDSNYNNDGANGLNSIAAGYKAKAYGTGSLAIGYLSFAGNPLDDTTGYSSMAIGPYAQAKGTGAIAFGNSSKSLGFGGVALGGGATVGQYSMGGVALGGTSSVTVTGGVALGTGSQASTGSGQTGYLSGSKKPNQADSVWTSTIGTVSVGGGTFKVGSEEKIHTRQIVNLAAGTQDTDAVNVAQLKAVEQEGISLTGNDNQTITQSLKSNDFTITGGLTGDDLQSASTANLGVRQNAAGNGLEVVMTTAPSFNQITVKNSSTADGASDISITGTGLSMGGKKITSLAAGTETDDAATYGQVSAISTDLSAFEAKTISVSGNEGSLSRKLGDSPIQIKGAGSKDNENYSGTNLKTYVDSNGALQILLDKELLEDRIDVGSALANPTESRVNYPVVLGTDATDATIGYVGINGRNGTSAVITSYAGSPIPGSDFNYTDSEGKSRMTRLEYTDQEGHAHHLATLTDGLTFGGDNSQVQIDSDSGTVSGTNVISRKLRATEYGKNNTTTNYLQIKGGADADKLSDSNIGVQASSDDGSLTIKLSQELKDLTSAQFGTATINGSGLTLGNTGISLTSSGLNNGGQKITNVQAGDISSTSTDAIIGSQLTNILNADGSAKGISFGADSAAGSHTNPTSVAIGGTVTLKGAGGDSSHKNLSTQVTDKGELTVAMASEIQENKIYVGNQISQESSPTGKVNYPVILGENTVGTDTYGYVGIKGKNNSQLYLTADKDTSNNTRLDYLDANNNAHLVALTSDGYTFAGDVGTANTLSLNSTLSITGGINQTEKLTTGNIGVVSNGNGGLTVELAKNLTNLTSASFGSGTATTTVNGNGVTAPAYKVGTKTYINGDGINANEQKITNVQAGDVKENSTEAVNGSQLFVTNQNVTKNAGDITDLTTRLNGAGMTFTGDSGSTTVNLNGTLHVKGADNNLTVTGDTDGLKLGLSKKLTELTSVEVSGSDFKTTLAGDGLTITPTSGDSPTPIVFTAGDGINLGNRKITGVKKGDVQSDSQEAVNGGQLFDVQTTANQAAAYAKKHSSVTVAGSTDGSNVTSGNLLLTKETNTAGGNQYDLRLNDVLTLGTGNTPITLDGTNGTVTFKKGADTTLQLDGSAGTITGLTNTSYTSLDSLIADKAASEGELQQVAQRVLDMANNGVVNAGNSGSATLKMGQTNTVAGSAVASGKTVDNDYSDANITTVASGDNQGNTTTHIYMKKDLVGNSMNVGTVGADGNIAAPVASLGQAASTATANGESIGQLYLSGEKRLGTGESGNTSATLHVKDIIGGNLTNATEATTRLFYTNESGAENMLAVVGKDGLQFAGDRGDSAKVTLNNILNIKGGAASTASLTSGNIAVTSDGNNTLNIQLAKNLTGLSSAVFVGNDFTSTIQGDGLTITPNNTTGTAQAISLTKNTISMGNRTIQNVADGDITKSDSKEAVNGGQLYSVKQTAEAAQTEAAKHTVITANDSEPANSTTGNVVLTSSDDQGKTTYNIKLNNKITLGSGDNQVVLDGSDSGTSSFGKSISFIAGTGAISAGSLTTSGLVTANGGVKVDDISLDPKTNTITGLNNTTFDQTNIVNNRAATEGQLQSLVNQISAGTVTGGTTALTDGTNTHVDSTTANKVTTYAVNVDDALTHMTSATFEKKNSAGNVTATSYVDADGLILGTTTDTTAARFTRNGISAGAQQIKNLGSGITGTDGQVTTYDPTVTGQADYNNAASIGDVQRILHAAQDVFAGNNSSKATLTLGKTATFKGTDVVDSNGNPLTDTALSSKLQADYSNANITTATSADSDGGVTTNFYLKKDLVGRSLSLGMIDSTTGAVLQPGAKLSSQALSNTDSTQIGHLFLAGEKQTGDNQTGYTSADFYVKDDKGSYLTDANKPVTRVFFNDETGVPYELATLSDGFHVVGDNSNVQTSLKLKLNKTLKVNGGVSDSDKLTTGNIGVLASQATAGEDGTLTIQLAKELTGLSSAAFTGDSTNVVVNGKGIMVTPSTGTDTEKAAGTFALSQDNVSMGSQKVHYVKAGTDDMDAVNVKQLTDTVSPIKTTADQAAAEAMKHSSVTVAGSTEGTDVTSGNLLLTKTNPNSMGGNNYDLKLNDVITLGGNSTTPITLDGNHGLITFNNGSNTTLQMNGQTGVITGLTNTTWDKKTAVSNRAASEGQLQALNTLLDSTKTSGITIAGTSDTGSVLQLGKKAAFVGSAVQDGKTIADDYSDANVTTVTSSSDSDGNTMTHFYMKQDLVGRSLTLGTIGSDGNVAESGQIVSLYQTQSKAENDTAMTGHLFLSGEARTKAVGNPSITHTSADLFVKDGAEGDKGYLKDKDLPVTRIYYTDEGNDTYALATMKDGLHVAGDIGTTSDLFLNQTLKLTGQGTAQTGYTSGNIGIYSNGNGTLDVQLADTLTGLENIDFANSTVSIGQNGIDAGDKQIAKVASGLPSGTALKDASDTILQNAANIGDVKNAAAAATTEVRAGKNVSITDDDIKTAEDGHKIYTINANFNGADVSGSNALVYDNGDKTQVTLGGSSSTTPVKLTNLAKGTISSNSTDAVTGKQLYDVIAYRDQTINVTGSTGSAVKLNHGNTLTISGDSNISTSSSGSDTARDGSLQVSLADNVYLQGIHIGSTYPTHDDTSVDSVTLTADANNQTGILTLRGDATHVSDAYPRAQADISVLSAAPDQTYAAAPFLQEVYQTSNSGIITQNQPVRLAYRDNYNTAHQVATLDDGYVFSGDNGDKNLTEKLNGTVALRGMDNAHASQITSDTANTYLTKNNIGVVTKPKVLNEDGTTQGGEVEIRLAKNLTGLTSATFTNDNGDTAVIDAKNLKLTLNAQTEGKSPVSLTSNGLDNGKNKITNVADGTSDLDAVNYGQIKSIINSGDGKIKGLTFAAGDNTSATVHLGDTLKIAGATDTDGAQNIHTTIKDDGTLTLQLDRKVQVDELHVGQKNSDVASLTAVQLDGNAGSIGQLYLKGINGAQAAVFTTMGSPSLDSTNQNTTTRLVYSNGMAGNIQHEIATLEDGLKFTGDNYTAASGEKAEQNVVKTQLNQTLHITGGQTDNQQLTTLEDKNIGVVAENGGLSVRLSKVLDGMTDIYMGDTRENSSHLTKNGLYLSPKSSTEYLAKFTADDGISAGSQTINNVKDGNQDSDAATVGQLRTIEAKANVATRLTVNHGQPNGNLILTDTPDKDGIHHTYDVALSDKVTVGSTGNSITLDGNANTINGGSYVQFGGQTSDTGDVIANPLSIGWQSAGLQDVLTDQDKGSQTGNYLTGLSNTRWDPMNVGYSPSRAATEGQLKDLESRISNNMEVKQVTVSGVNDNITVTPAADNPNHYQVKLSDTLKLGQDAKVTIDGNNGTITGLTNKTIDAPGFATQGRAATEEQLKQVADSVGNLDKAASKTDFQLVGEKDKDGNYTGDYEVSDDNKVKLHVQDKMHPDQVKDITIDNVAKASDIGDVSRISEDIQNKEHNTVVDSLNKLNEKVKDAANGSWESQIDGKTVKKIKAGDVQNFTSGDNIQLSNDNGAIKIAAKKDVSFDKVTIGSGDSQMTLDKDGLQTGKVKVSHSEINAGGNQIHGVSDGTEKDDAATVGQVDTKVNEVDTKVDKVADAAGTAINTLGNHINRLDRRINKVGAGAAALAALHPDPNSDDDLSFAAGIGNYRGSTAAALGAFYRPSDNVTVSMGATIGNGENMVNAGVTIGVGEGVGRNPSTRKAMAKEISQLKEANAAKDAEVRDLKKQVQTLQKQNEDTQEKLKRIMEKLGI